MVLSFQEYQGNFMNNLHEHPRVDGGASVLQGGYGGGAGAAAPVAAGYAAPHQPPPQVPQSFL